LGLQSPLKLKRQGGARLFPATSKPFHSYSISLGLKVSRLQSEEGENMKRFIACSCALTLGLYLSNLPAHAQGKGGGHGPSVASHAVDHSDHGKDSNNDKNHGATHAADETHTQRMLDRINDNPALKAKVTSVLNGMDLKTAVTGFKNDGQFMAAVNVSKNLGIPFADLKAKMMGPPHESLGQAIHDLKPSVTEDAAKKDAETAEKEAKLALKTKPLS
jgi:hypothetical protein